MNSHAEITALIDAAFASESGPARCRNPKHCDECTEADRMLLDLDPRDLDHDDLTSERRNWIFSFATDESLRWLTPGIVRVALEQNPPQPSLFFDLIRQQTSDAFTDEQWLAILDLADYSCDGGWTSRADLGFIGPGACRNEQNAAGQPATPLESK